MSNTRPESPMQRPINDLITELATQGGRGLQALLVDSEPGLGRNAMIQAALAEQLPGEHVILDPHSAFNERDLLGPRTAELENAAVIVVDGLGYASHELREAILTLVFKRQSSKIPIKFQKEPRVIELRRDVVFLFSEQTFNADEIDAVLTDAFPTSYRRVALV